MLRSVRLYFYPANMGEGSSFYYLSLFVGGLNDLPLRKGVEWLKSELFKNPFKGSLKIGGTPYHAGGGPLCIHYAGKLNCPVYHFLFRGCLDKCYQGLNGLFILGFVNPLCYLFLGSSMLR